MAAHWRWANAHEWELAPPYAEQMLISVFTIYLLKNREEQPHAFKQDRLTGRLE